MVRRFNAITDVRDDEIQILQHFHKTDFDLETIVGVSAQKNIEVYDNSKKSNHHAYNGIKDVLPHIPTMIALVETYNGKQQPQPEQAPQQTTDERKQEQEPEPSQGQDSNIVKPKITTVFIEVDGERREVTKQELFALAKTGLVQPGTVVTFGDQTTTASRIRGIEFVTDAT